MTRYGVLLSCASEMVTPGLVVEHRTEAASAETARMIAVTQSGVETVICHDDGDGWVTATGVSPREWLGLFQ